MRYAKPKSIDEALALLAQDRWRILAGGTDFYAAQGRQPHRKSVLDINGLDELRGIRQTPAHYVIGARTTWTDLIEQGGLPAAFDALRQSAAEIGSFQVQNVGTIGGNLCNASPAADGVPPLLVLDAEVELRSRAGRRRLPLAHFILGNRRTAREREELLTAIRIPKGATTGTSHFIKLGARRYLVISIAMAAARIVTGQDGKVAQAALAIGSCSEVATRLGQLEAAMAGRAAGAALGALVGAHRFDELSPIDDVRATADYRRLAAREMTLRALRGALGLPLGPEIEA